MTGPLEGIRILDTTSLFPGPYGMRLLADYGAEVIKIEYKGKPDLARYLPPFVKRKDGKNGRWSFFYHFLNRNKKNLSLNLRKPEGLEVFKRLVKKSDVIVVQFRPGVVEKLGIDYESMKKVNPKIVYCSITGYGEYGPYKFYPGHDLNYIGVAGVGSVTRNEKNEPMLPGLQLADMVGGGLYSVIAILMAIISRENTGKGQFLDISMMDGALSLLPMPLGQYLAGGEEWKPILKEMTLCGATPSYQIFETKDNKYVAVGALEPKFHNKLYKELDLDIKVGESSQASIKEKLAEKFKLKTRDQWIELLIDKDACVTPLYEIKEVPNDPQVKARGLIIEVETEEGPVKQIGFPMKFSETKPEIRYGAAMRVGQDSKEILKELLDYNDEEIKGLKKNKVI
ncbi:MAG: CoA transferase [Promethearchaeota archaeon]|nr:MAG: CoA transferase [Candidatus Lokiarchaeota archaeon]